MKLILSIKTMNNLTIHPIHHQQQEAPAESGGFAAWTSTFLVAIILGAVILVTVIGNVFVILAILFERDLRTRPQYYLIFSLAVADLMIGMIVSPLIEQSWQLGVGLCDFWISMDVLACTASILHLVAIALDRYWSITDIFYSRKRTPTRIGFMLLIVWLLSLLISMAPMMGWKDSEFNSRVVDSRECLISQDLSYQIFSTTAAFYAPLILIVFIYWKIFKAARHRIRKGRGKRLSAAQTLTTSTLPMGNNNHSTGSSSGTNCAQQCSTVAAAENSLMRSFTVSNTELYNSEGERNPPSSPTAEGISSSTPHGQIGNFSSRYPQKSATGRPLLFPQKNAGRNRERSSTNGMIQTSGWQTATTGNHNNMTSLGAALLSSGAAQPLRRYGSETTALNHSNQSPLPTTQSPLRVKSKRRKRSRESSEAEARRERKAWRTLAIITGCFVGSWLPFFILAIARPVCAHFAASYGGPKTGKYCQFNPIMTSVFLWLGYFNSAVNPIIYTIFSPDFRQAFERIIKRLCFVIS